MPPTTPLEPVNDVESTRAPEADPTVPEQRFRFRSEGEEVEAPAAPAESAPEAPAAPMDAPAAPAADASPADAPAAPAAPAVVPADVPAAAPMAEPQPDAEVAPAAPAEGVAPAAPVAPEVAATPEVGAVEPAPAAPAEEAPVDNAAPQARFKQEGEEITIQTEEPRTPPEVETAECPETGDEYVDKNIKEPINPVIEQEDGLAEEPTHDDVTAITPETAEDDEALAEIDQCMRMEDEAEVEAGDQDVNATVNVNVRKDDGDEHAEDTAETGAEVSDDGDQAPEQCGGSKKLFKSEGDQIETVADIVDAPPAEDVVPVPDPNAGSPDASGDPNQMFGQWMQEGGDWL